MKITCINCGKIIADENHKGISASISGSIMGDEYFESYFYCDECEVYTLEIYHDRFLGEDDIRYQGPISKAKGEEIIKLIQQCERPWDKKCRCEAHKKYFGDSLD